MATDHYQAALDFTRHNARLNLGDEPETRLLDWNAPAMGDAEGGFDLVLAADVLYEKRNAEALTRLIPTLLASGGEVLVADPGRRWEPLFRENMKEMGFGFVTEETVVENGERGVTVLVHRLSR